MTFWYAGLTLHNRHVEFDKYKYTKKMCAPNWFYLQDYTEKHSQQNINKSGTYVQNVSPETP